MRLGTHRSLAAHPLPVEAACTLLQSWLMQAQLSVIVPGPEHARLLCRLLAQSGTGGNLTTDAHLAALAIEHQAQLHSADADFSRFPGLRWRNPLAS